MWEVVCVCVCRGGGTRHNYCLKNHPNSYLQFLAIFVIHGHGDLHILGGGLAALVKLALDQGHIDVIAHITLEEMRKKLSKEDSEICAFETGVCVCVWGGVTSRNGSRGHRGGSRGGPVLLTRHDDLRKAHLACHGGGTVDQVREVLPDLVDVSRKSLQRHPKTWQRPQTCDITRLTAERLHQKMESFLKTSSLLPKFRIHSKSPVYHTVTCKKTSKPRGVPHQSQLPFKKCRPASGITFK